MKYFISNKFKTFTLILVIAISVFTVYLVSSIVQSIFSTAESANVHALSKFSVIIPNGSDMIIKDEQWKMIEENPMVSVVYQSYIEQTSINNILGKSTGFVVFLSQRDLKDVFYKCGFEITSGRLPIDSEYEIIMHEDMIKNKGLSVGDKFGNSIDLSESVVGEYVIVGTFKGDCVIGLGTKNYSVNQLESAGLKIENALFSGVVFPSQDLESLNCMLDSKNGVESYTSSDIKKKFDEQITGISILMLIIIIVVVIGISCAVGVALSTVYNSRMDEFGILYAIGYSKQRILFKKIIEEISKLVISSWVLGMLLSIIIIKVIDFMIFQKMGQSIIVFSGQSLIYTFVSLIAIFITTSLPIMIKLSKADLVTVIERR